MSTATLDEPRRMMDTAERDALDAGPEADAAPPNTAALQAARANAELAVRDAVRRVGAGEALPDGWPEAVVLSGWTVERFTKAVEVAEARFAARKTLEKAKDAELKLLDAEGKAESAYATALKKAERQREELEAKITATLEPIEERRRELARQRAAMRYGVRDAQALLKSTADASHIARTDAEIKSLEFRREKLSRDVLRYSRAVDEGKSDEATARSVAKWRGEIGSIDARIRSLESQRYDC